MKRRRDEDASDSTLSPLTAIDGDTLAVRSWPPSPEVERRGVVVLVHGLGEHAGRYERLAQRLTGWGFTVIGYDQCGHGESAGVRGWVPSGQRLIDDLADVVDSAQRERRPGEPLVLIGHSMGAVVAGLAAQERELPVDGLVLSSPAFEPVLTRWQRLLLAIVPRIAPDLRVSNGILPEGLSRDGEWVEAYRNDPLVHDRVSGRLAAFLVEGGRRLLAAAPAWKLPTLVLWAGSDVIVRPRATRAFVAAAPRKLVTAHGYEDLYHEVFNEVENEPVYRALRRWLEHNFVMDLSSNPVPLDEALREHESTPAMPGPPHTPAPVLPNPS